MRQQMNRRWRGFRASGGRSLEALVRWRRHEWRSLQGHAVALLERIRVARQARSVNELIHQQVDLLPESRRRLRRNAQTRRVILGELLLALRQTMLGRS
jgi:hypothetical protein